ncbi:hypothetical protein N9499_09075 [Octadecabacter sp.]|nr:hypothetical protein [Octadecabacter sp.]
MILGYTAYAYWVFRGKMDPSSLGSASIVEWKSAFGAQPHLPKEYHPDDP